MLNTVTIIASKMTSHCAGTVEMRESQKAGQESEKRCDLRRQQKMEREGAAVTCDGRLLHRRAAATGTARASVENKTVDQNAERERERERERKQNIAAQNERV